jgi:hypothetical protein
MALAGCQQQLLLLVWQGTEAVRDSWTDNTSGELALCSGRQVPADVNAARHPVGLSTEQASDLSFCLLVVVEQRTDHPGFVQSGQRPARVVGDQHQALVLH